MLNLILSLILVVLLIYIFSTCRLTCGNKVAEGYWTLPFAGGSVRTFAPDPHRIEGPLGRAMDETDMDEGPYGDYPI